MTTLENPLIFLHFPTARILNIEYLIRKQRNLNNDMSNKQLLQVFEHYRVRTVWDEETQKWYFSVVDVVAVLTDSSNPQTYWRVLKNRLAKEGNETVTNCNAFKLRAPDGKMRMSDVADIERNDNRAIQRV